MAIAFVAIGSNLGDRQGNLDRAVELLSAVAGVRLTARSRNLETAAVGGPADQGDYLNGVVALDCQLSPRDLLHAVQRIEREMGRPPVEQRIPCGPRVIDLDLLLYDNAVLCDEEMCVPHPRMHMRRFVLEPLVEIAPDARHPLLAASAREMLDWLTAPTRPSP